MATPNAAEIDLAESTAPKFNTAENHNLYIVWHVGVKQKIGI